MSRYQVRTAELREIAGMVAAAADAAKAVVEHPGVVRGRAQDGGDDDLRDQAARFADRWEHGLRLMAAQAQRMADALRLAADTYDQAERASAAAWSRTGGRW